MATARKRRMPKLLFIDANIWLDFYRGKSEAALDLLRHIETVGDRLIVTYQLEMEYKKNRQIAILDGMKVLSPAPPMPRLGVFSDAKELAAEQRAARQAHARVVKLKKRLLRILEKPATHDEVYKVIQRLFHREAPIVLTRDNPVRRAIRNRAWRRFLMGYPPRKASDTSFGDAINWEWMIECCDSQAAELVIVSRDCDYGIDHSNVAYINDFLRHEFSDRVSRKREVLLCRRLSEALKHFEVAVTEAEEKEESALITASNTAKSSSEESRANSLFQSFVTARHDLRTSLLDSLGESMLKESLREFLVSDPASTSDTDKKA
jgi:predicted nucleic acid-binding protein